MERFYANWGTYNVVTAQCPKSDITYTFFSIFRAGMVGFWWSFFQWLLTSNMLGGILVGVVLKMDFVVSHKKDASLGVFGRICKFNFYF